MSHQNFMSQSSNEIYPIRTTFSSLSTSTKCQKINPKSKTDIKGFLQSYVKLSSVDEHLLSRQCTAMPGHHLTLYSQDEYLLSITSTQSIERAASCRDCDVMYQLTQHSGFACRGDCPRKQAVSGKLWLSIREQGLCSQHLLVRALECCSHLTIHRTHKNDIKNKYVPVLAVFLLGSNT